MIEGVGAREGCVAFELSQTPCDNLHFVLFLAANLYVLLDCVLSRPR